MEENQTIVRECKRNEVEEVLKRIHEEFEGEYDEIAIEDKNFGDEHRIYVDDIRIVIPELGISVREGTFCNYDEEEENYLTDFSITLIYDADEEDASNYLYWEQDGPAVTIHNFLSAKKHW